MPRTPRRWWEWFAVAVLAILLATAAVTGWWMTRYARAVQRLTRGVGDTVFYGADGKPWFRLDEQRHDVPLYDIAADLQHAVVSVEDRRFYAHPGIDPFGLARAIVRDIQLGRAAEGGSTLTQQLARTLFLSNRRTFARKGKEASIALLLELLLTKDQILELYLNRVYLSAGVYGVDAMAQHLFRKPAGSLTLPEAAMVAGLIQAPSTLSPWTNYEGALARSRVVLGRMREQHWITEEQERAARAARPRLEPYRSPRDPRGGWAKDWLRQQFRNEFGGDHPPGWRVQTSFLPAVQEAAERAVAAGVGRLPASRGVQVALVAVDPATGNVLAMIGGVDYRRSTFNRATRGRRQPGSAFKPFVFAAALARGYSPVSVLPHLDAVSAPDDPEWRPRSVSHGGEAPDALPVRVALADSNNAAAVALQQAVGTNAVLRLATDAGLRDLPEVPSLALGTGLVTPLDLTAAYSIFPGAGQVVVPRGIIGVFDGDGDSRYDRPVDRRRVVSEQVAFQMTSMLRDVVDRGTGSAARTLGVAGPVAGKTGTTDAYHDAWFVGFSSSVVVGVWVGHDTPRPIGREAYAAKVAVPIWADFMKRTARLLPAAAFQVPAGLEAVELCRISHVKPVSGCPVYTEYFKDGDPVPSVLCPIHEGSFRQVATRAVRKFLGSIGGRIAGVFRRH